MNPFNVNPFNVFGYIVKYFTAAPVPAPPQGGGNALLLLGYLMWVNSGSSKKRRSQSKYCKCNKNRYNDSEASAEVIEMKDSDSEDRVEPSVPAPTTDSVNQLSNRTDEAQLEGGNIYNLRQRRVLPAPQKTPRVRSSHSTDYSNPLDLVTIQSQSTCRHFNIRSEESYTSTPRYRRRMNKKGAPKRLQKNKKPLKKKTDKDMKDFKAQEEKKTEYNIKTLSQRFRNIRYCSCCGCEMFG